MEPNFLQIRRVHCIKDTIHLIIFMFCSSVIYGRLGVYMANALIASIMPFESAWTSDKKLLSPFHIVVNESIWAIQSAERCLKKYIVEENACFKGVEDSVVLAMVKELSALSVAHEVKIFLL